MKYVDTLVSFSEIPDEITLCINISNCPNKCEGCHSSWLQENIGIELNDYELYDIINKNSGISCVCFMGGDSNPEEINDLAIKIKSKNLKVGWYSGNSKISDKINIKNFDYIKIGPYLKDKGPLSDKNTNQKMYEIIHFTGMNSLKDITYKFWK
jgi:anaerobic ribonucleoside-triphosphate reductase activating protein